jgi:hypothetical protein
MGAIELSATWRSTASPAAIYAVVVDLATWPQWWPAIQQVDPLSGDASAPDVARLIFDTPAALRPLQLELTVTERTSPSLLLVEVSDGPIRGDGRIDIDADEHGSATSFEVALDVRSRWLKPIELLLASATRGAGRERLARAGDDLARLAGGEPRDHDV